MVLTLKGQLRTLETLGKPVVAAINGAALGGGWEICLACHHRVALDDASVQLGLPEVTLGLLPGGGGVVRMVRMLGIEKALPYLLEGKKVRPQQALQAGLIDALATDRDDLLAKARAWIVANPAAVQRWDVKGYQIPGGTPSNPKVAPMLAIAPSILRSKTQGTMPAPEKILCAAVEGAQVDFDTAHLIETRYFTELTTGQISKNLIGTFWFQLNEINAGGSRPQGIAPYKTQKVGVLGAGMMGAGIAFVSASAGIDVVLKDINLAAAEKGKAHSAALLDKKVARGQMNAAQRDEVLARIKPSESDADLAGCDLIIEAVFEDRELKAKVSSGSPTGGGRRSRDRFEYVDSCRSLGWRRPCRIQANSSACISSARWKKCRWWKSSKARKPAMRPWLAASTSCCKSRKPRSWSTTVAAFLPRGYSAPSPMKASPCSAKASAHR